MSKLIRDNGLSLAFWMLFVLALAGNVAAAALLPGEEPATHAGQHGIAAAIASPEFLKGVVGNWQAALLQLLVLIVLAKFLRQRGAAHSREPLDEAAREALTKPQRIEPEEPGPALRHLSVLYQHSLSLAFGALFLVTLVVFFFVDLAAVNQARGQAGERALTTGAFATSARFWFDLLGTWEAEFFAMALFLVLTIFLREKGSPESKAVDAADRDTGDTNE